MKEYLTYNEDQPLSEDKLEAIGSSDWQLVGFVYETPPAPRFHYVFMRDYKYRG